MVRIGFLRARDQHGQPKRICEIEGGKLRHHALKKRGRGGLRQPVTWAPAPASIAFFVPAKQMFAQIPTG